MRWTKWKGAEIYAKKIRINKKNIRNVMSRFSAVRIENPKIQNTSKEKLLFRGDIWNLSYVCLSCRRRHHIQFFFFRWENIFPFFLLWQRKPLNCRHEEWKFYLFFSFKPLNLSVVDRTIEIGDNRTIETFSNWIKRIKKVKLFDWSLTKWFRELKDEKGKEKERARARVWQRKKSFELQLMIK